ncbi:MAG: MerR family DNA-binding transcriptional regulator [Candidatus Rokubacteria bacterium]|nr:MerR family DNA-binding transcriptional regulator [Candidatus Rokubacteria bacterium]
MSTGGLLIGAVAARSGLSRKALRLYEAAGILPRAARTPAGYRVYPTDTLALLGFVARARRLLTALLRSAATRGRRRAVVCPHIEGAGSGREPAARRRRT